MCLSVSRLYVYFRLKSVNIRDIAELFSARSVKRPAAAHKFYSIHEKIGVSAFELK